MNPLIALDEATKRFHVGTPDEAILFDAFSFSAQEGEFVSIIGSNGSGKTTLLNLLCGSMTPDSGRILYRGRDVTRMKEHQRAAFIGRVFQDPARGSCAGLTLLQNLALADNKGKRYGLGRAVSRSRVDEYRTRLEMCGMGLENRLQVTAGSLSGGQRQALALVLATMTDIEALLLDEHTAALDPKSSERVMEVTRTLVEKKKITTLMVTHNLRFAVEYGDRLVMMHEGKAKLDMKGEQKRAASIDDLLRAFNEISIECGN